jgi:hypothetical protein
MSPQVGVPVAGFYTCRLIRDGVRVAVRIWFGQPIVEGEVQDRSPRWCCEVDGCTDRNDYDADGNRLGRVPLDPLLDDPGVWTHCCGNPISEREYDFLNRRRLWAVEHAPDHPAANPRTPVDVRALKPGW